jgi:hypothetical protein
MKPRPLSDNDFTTAAAMLGCDVAIIKAFAIVESGSYGFWQFGADDWRPAILFEAHYFSRLTNHVYDMTHPQISSRNYNPSLYVFGKKEYDRLDEACSLNREAGLQSASWGKFQIMGANWKRVGAPSLQDFINQMYSVKNHAEADHLDAFCHFIMSDSALHNALLQHDFETMARRYNGAGAVEQYSKKLQNAYMHAVIA